MIKIKSVFLLSFLFLILLIAMNPVALEARNQSNSSLFWDYSRYFGGSDEDYSQAIAVDKDGYTYVTGYSKSSKLPGIFEDYSYGEFDVFVAKFDSAGTLVFCIRLGGSSDDLGDAIAVDNDGNIYITGLTGSRIWFPDFPIIFGAYSGSGDAFVLKLDSQGNPLWFAYLGGSEHDNGIDIKVDTHGNVYITGSTESQTWSSYLPIILGVHNGKSDAFVLKLDSQGNPLWFAYLGGSEKDVGRGIDLDEMGNVYGLGWTKSSNFPVTLTPKEAYDTSYANRQDFFIFKLNPEGYIVYATYLGGEWLEEPQGIDVDRDGKNIYVTGFNLGGDFPTTTNVYDSTYNGWWDIVVAKFSSADTDPDYYYLAYSTYIGTSDDDEVAFAIAVDSKGNAYIIGHSTNVINEEHVSVIVIKLNSTGTDLIHSIRFGGSNNDSGKAIVIQDESGDVCVVSVTGWTDSSNFPVTFGSFYGDKDVFVGRILFPTVVNLTISTTTGGTTNPTPGTYVYDEGAEATITATPHNGYKFSRWSGDAWGTDNLITVTLDKDKSITAHFTAIPDEPDEPEPDNCFIATAAYGSFLHPSVKKLRDFRDKYLMTNKLGRKFVKLYYKHSPPIADLIRKHKALKVIVRGILSPIVAFND